MSVPTSSGTMFFFLGQMAPSNLFKKSYTVEFRDKCDGLFMAQHAIASKVPELIAVLLLLQSLVRHLGLCGHSVPAQPNQ